MNTPASQDCPRLAHPRGDVIAQRRTTRLRALLERKGTDFLLEAHDGLSARIVEGAGFPAIWASGLAISAQWGVRDNNEASWTQVVEVAEFMADATSVPILLDGDTGYGNFNNVRRLVTKLEQRGIAGVCIEDKTFPKANSFLDGTRQPLADVDEFCGKIRAARDVATDPDFCVVARVEALIAGWGVDEALRRAAAYHDAGANAIFIHSAKTEAGEILRFAEAWSERSPLLIAPTKYATTPTETFVEAGISAVLWANQTIRAAVHAMQSVANEIFETRQVSQLDNRIATLDELFRLQRVDELKQAEARYFPSAAARAEEPPRRRAG